MYVIIKILISKSQECYSHVLCQFIKVVVNFLNIKIKWNSKILNFMLECNFYPNEQPILLCLPLPNHSFLYLNNHPYANIYIYIYIYIYCVKVSMSLLRVLNIWDGYIYIYIYIYYIILYYIIRVLVVTKSLCGYVSNQVQYNMESAQYLG